MPGTLRNEADKENIAMDFQNEESNESSSFAEEKDNQHRRAKLRSEYRNVIENMQGDGAEDPAALDRINELFQDVTKPREMSYDAQAMALFATNQYQKVERLQTNLVTFNPQEFAEKLLTHMDGRLMDEDEDQRPIVPNHAWIKFGRSVAHLIKTTPTFHFLYGSFDSGDVEVKTKVRRQRQKDTEKYKEVAPKEIKQTDTNDKEGTTEIVEDIFKDLLTKFNENNGQPICYFRFVVDPNSFGHTIENIFHVSFLVRDGKVNLALDDRKLPTLEPCAGDANRSKREHKQFILSLTQDDYHTIIENFKLKTQ